ncbi:MAG: hypothetical protein ABR985_11085 [Methanotrichaceae archaeon]|jgi:hypothetical protein
MPGDLMDSVFGDIKTKKDKGLRSETLIKETLSDETLRFEGINIKLLNEAIQNTNSKRKMIGVWSPLIAASMWYLKSTIPRFSISDAARAWIEAGLEKEYPELVKKVKDEMGKSDNK